MKLENQTLNEAVRDILLTMQNMTDGQEVTFTVKRGSNSVYFDLECSKSLVCGGSGLAKLIRLARETDREISEAERHRAEWNRSMKRLRELEEEWKNVQA